MGSHARQSIDTSIVSQSKVQLIHCQCKSRLQIANLGINKAFLAATKQPYEWYFLSVRLSVCPSHLFDYVPIIISSWNSQELSPRTRVTSMQKVKVRGQRSRSQVTTQLNPFRTVTPVWIHIWWWNATYSLMLLRRGALLFFKVFR